MPRRTAKWRFSATATCCACWPPAGWAFRRKWAAASRCPPGPSACSAMSAIPASCRAGIRPHNKEVDRPWLWPNLLSLDAPIVALLWQILFARCFHAPLDPLPSILLVLAVWLIYAADRTIDSFTGAGSRPRHDFYRRHWRALLPLWIFAAAGGMALAWTRLNREMLFQGCALGAAVVVYFALLHVGSLHKTKEAAVAVLFA